MKNYLIVVAAGSGSRMGTEIPKQFLPLHGQPVIARTISRFLQFDPEIEIVVVLRPEYSSQWNEIAEKYFSKISFTICEGGSERYFSVQNALHCIKDKTGIVAIHDAVRPLVSKDTIAGCFAAAEEKGNAIPIVAVNDSLRHLTTNGSRKVNRNEFCMVQTPQCFRLDKILPAFKSEWHSSFTDDASVLEATGEEIHLVKGNYENIKITTPTDLKIAHALWVDE
jgi:2-C-methyl-D-erythritol 4-phosphate cytidylyltransferase